MQIVFWILFLVVTLIGLFYMVSFEKVTKEYKQLEKEYDSLNRESFKARTINMLITDLVLEYRKDKENTNIFTIMRKILDIILDNKEDISTGKVTNVNS